MTKKLLILALLAGSGAAHAEAPIPDSLKSSIKAVTEFRYGVIEVVADTSNTIAKAVGVSTPTLQAISKEASSKGNDTTPCNR